MQADTFGLTPPTVAELLSHLKSCGVHVALASQLEPSQLRDFYVPPPNWRERDDTYISITDNSDLTRQDVERGIRMLEDRLAIDIDRSDPMAVGMARMELGTAEMLRQLAQRFAEDPGAQP